MTEDEHVKRDRQHGGIEQEIDREEQPRFAGDDKQGADVDRISDPAALRTDLIALLSTFEALLSQEPFPRMMAAFINAAECDPTLSRLHTQLTERRREPLRHVLAEARRRGEISPTTDLELAIDLLAGPAFYRRFVAHWPFPRDYAAAIVDLFLTAVRTDPGKERMPRKRIDRSPGGK